MKDASRWSIAAASVTGSSHVRVSLPCQDSAIAKVFHDAAGDEILVIVVADGAGSASRAEIGSSIACSTISEAAEVYFAAGGQLDGIDIGIATSWVQMVRKAVSIRAEEDIGTLRDYACTLLVAVVGQDSSAILQIGDGAIVVSDGAGWSWVHWPQRGEFANTTFFVTEENAEKRMAFDSCKGRIDEIAVLSDGIEPLVLEYSTQTVFAPFFDKMFPAVRALETEGIDQGLSNALATYLDSPAICARTDDDKTLVLATRISANTAPPPHDSIIQSEDTDE
jgi:hypothetical protein